MSVSFMPYAFQSGENLDLERLNDSLKALARSTERNLDARYTYGPPMFFSLDGVADSSAAALRTFPIRRPASGRAVEIVGVELVLYGSGAAGEATLECSDSSWPSIVVDCVDSATTEVHGSSGVPVSVPSHSSDVTFTLTLPSGYTVTRGDIIVHTRCDRGNQGGAHVAYTPTLLSTASEDIGELLDAELEAAADAVSDDANNDIDWRAECFVARNLASGSSVTWRLPSGARRIGYAHLYVVAAATETLTADISGNGITPDSVAVVGTGATARAHGSEVVVGTMNDDPTDSADDATITFTASGGGTVLLAFLHVWWS